MHKFRGKVRIGKKRGKTLGFPTANINLHRRVPEGIYISLVKIEGKTYPALTFVGKAVTFKETLYQAESYILDFNQDLYNKWISVKLLKKIRGNKKFKSVEDLVKAMKNDEKIARKYFKDHV